MKVVQVLAASSLKKNTQPLHPFLIIRSKNLVPQKSNEFCAKTAKCGRTLTYETIKTR